MRLARWMTPLSVIAIVVCAALLIHYGALKSKVQYSDPLPVIAQVGNGTIDSLDLKFRQQVSELYYPGSTNDVTALGQMIETLLATEMLARRGTVFNEELLETEARRIDRETRNPEMLDRIKNVFGTDRRRYLRAFVLPSAAKSKIWMDFQGDRQLHQKALQRAQDALSRSFAETEFWNQILADREMKKTRIKITRNGSVEVIESELSEEKIISGSTPKSAKRNNAARGFKAASSPYEVFALTPSLDLAAKILDQVLTGLNDGDLAPRILETDEDFQIIRLLRWEHQDSALCEVVAVRKPDFTRWFWEEARGVTIKIYDDRLLRDLKTQFAWANQMKLIVQKQG